jgi:HPt (histidine-containing phosphotransfer) domain-containing protein
MSSLDDALAAIWERSRPFITERLETIEATAAALASGTLGEDARREGVRAAHQLTGSLGTFGIPEGSDIARELEAQFEAAAGAGADAARATALSARLRELLAPRL